MVENRFLLAARQGRNGFWRYLLTIVLAFSLNLVASTVLLVAAIGATGSTNLAAFPDTLSLLVVMLPFALITAGLWFGLRFLHGRPFRSLVNPAGRMRWGSLLLSAGVWFGLSGLSDLILSALQPGNYSFAFSPGRFFPFLALALLLVPIQTSAEEFLFRGYLTQGFGLLSRGGLLLPWIIPAVLFGLLHSLNPEVAAYGLGWMMASYIGVGLLLGWITLRSQGLELSLGLHLANNLYSALMVTFASSAIPSPALFSIKSFDPRIAVLSLVIMAPLYLLLVSAWKHGAAWRTETPA